MSYRIRILATTDVHGYVYPYQYSNGKHSNIGFAQLNQMITSLRDENTLLLDNGDAFEGSPLSYYHVLKHPTEVSPVTQVMKEMKYDYINVGNHEFNYGPEVLMNHLQNVDTPCITSNFYHHNRPVGPNYVIQEIAGKKIAILGVVTHYIPNWESKANLKGFTFKDAFETLQKNVALVKKMEKPDYIIAMYHGGFERDLKFDYLTEEDTGENQASLMLTMIPDLDILITGHQHRSLVGTKNQIAYTQSGVNGNQLACIDIYPDTGVIEPRILDGEGIEDHALTELVQKEEDECQKWLDQTLGTCKIDLSIQDEDDARLHKSQLITYLNHVQMELTGADIASSALFLGATGFQREITMRNIVSTYVYPNTLVVKEVTGAVLKAYLEKCAEFFAIKADGSIGVSPEYDYPKPQHYNYDMLDGIEYIIKVSNPIGERIVSLTRKGRLISDTDVFTLCVNNYRASGGGNFNMIKEAPTIKNYTESMIDLLGNSLMKNPEIDFEPVHNIEVIL